MHGRNIVLADKKHKLINEFSPDDIMPSVKAEMGNFRNTQSCKQTKCSKSAVENHEKVPQCKFPPVEKQSSGDFGNPDEQTADVKSLFEEVMQPLLRLTAVLLVTVDRLPSTTNADNFDGHNSKQNDLVAASQIDSKFGKYIVNTECEEKSDVQKPESLKSKPGPSCQNAFTWMLFVIRGAAAVFRIVYTSVFLGGCVVFVFVIHGMSAPFHLDLIINYANMLYMFQMLFTEGFAAYCIFRNELESFLSDLSKLDGCRYLSRDDLRKSRRWATGLAATIGGNFIVLQCAVIWTVTYEDAFLRLRNLMFDWSPCDPFTKFMIVAAPWAVVANLISTIAFVSVCEIIRVCCHCYQKLIQSELDSGVTAEKLVHLKACFLRMDRVMDSRLRAMSVYYFVQTGFGTLSLLFALYYEVNAVARGVEWSYHLITFSFAALLVICLTLMSIAAESIANETSKTNQILARIDLESLSPSQDVQKISQLTWNFSHLLTSRFYGITFWGFFPITKGVILSIVSGFVSYFTLLVQFAAPGSSVLPNNSTGIS